MAVQWCAVVLLLGTLAVSYSNDHGCVDDPIGNGSSSFSSTVFHSKCMQIMCSQTLNKLKKMDFPHKSDSNKTILQLLLILSGDVELHPGPGVKFPCAICSRPVAKNHRAIQCDKCDFWCHIKCFGVTASQYNDLIGSSATWACPPCGEIQFSDSVFGDGDSIVALSNSFSVLSDDLDVASPITLDNRGPSQNRNCHTPLKVMSVNCNSLISDNRHALLSALLQDHLPDVVCMCETKLDATISDSALFPADSGYGVVIRKDNRLGAGGVLIAVRDTIVASPVMDLNANCEIV